MQLLQILQGVQPLDLGNPVVGQDQGQQLPLPLQILYRLYLIVLCYQGLQLGQLGQVLELGEPVEGEDEPPQLRQPIKVLYLLYVVGLQI